MIPRFSSLDHGIFLSKYIIEGSWQSQLYIASHNGQPDFKNVKFIGRSIPRCIPKRRWSRPIHMSGSPRVDSYSYPNFDATMRNSIKLYIYIYTYIYIYIHIYIYTVNFPTNPVVVYFHSLVMNSHQNLAEYIPTRNSCPSQPRGEQTMFHVP